MYEDLDGDAADGVEGAEDVERRRGAEAEDGLPLVQHYEGLQGRQRRGARGDMFIAGCHGDGEFPEMN